jgi:hypothetical protein
MQHNKKVEFTEPLRTSHHFEDDDFWDDVKPQGLK